MRSIPRSFPQTPPRLLPLQETAGQTQRMYQPRLQRVHRVLLDEENKQHVLRPVSVGASGANSENRLLQLDPGSLWWSDLSPINVLRNGRRTKQVGGSWATRKTVRVVFFGTLVLEFQRTCFFERQPGIQLVSRLTRDRSTILEQLSSSPLCHGASHCTRCLFQICHRSVSASYSRVGLTTLSNYSTLRGPDTNTRWSSITVARVASGSRLERILPTPQQFPLRPPE